MVQHTFFKTASAKRIKLQADLNSGSGNYFYTGFSDEIKEGGIFVCTYRLLPMHTPVEVNIHFPTDEIIVIKGVVEWVREHNSLTPLTVPGMGIGFSTLSKSAVVLIENYLMTSSALFWDNENADDLFCEKSVEQRPKYYDDIEIIDDSAALDDFLMGMENLDFTSEQIFLKGIVRDIEHYKKNQNRNSLTSLFKAGNSFKQSETLRVKIVPSSAREFFQGGFTEEDGRYKVFITTMTPHPIGSIIDLQIIFKDKKPLDTAAEVKWIRKYNPLISNPAAPPGMGVRLLTIEESAWKNIERERGVLPVCEPV
jgi:Tfp pilus assembly protein PilZ